MKNRNVLSVTLQSVLLIVGSYILGFYFTHFFHQPTSYVGGLWAAISGIIVGETTAKDTLHSAKIRIIGSLTGAIICAIYLSLFPFSILGFSICIALGVMICFLLKIQHSIKLTAITISVILIVSTVEHELHPVKNAALRFAESAIGSGLALTVAFTAHYFNKFKSKPH
jgi:uncharacterized membrane protein YgaE (UPF0421/DUF939 family)